MNLIMPRRDARAHPRRKTVTSLPSHRGLTATGAAWDDLAHVGLAAYADRTQLDQPDHAVRTAGRPAGAYGGQAGAGRGVRRGRLPARRTEAGVLHRGQCRQHPGVGRLAARPGAGRTARPRDPPRVAVRVPRSAVLPALRPGL